MTNLSPLYSLLETPEAVGAWLRDRRRAPTPERAIEAGAFLLQTLGWHAITTSAIARHIGVSQPTLYAHFSNLDAFLTRLLDALTDAADPWLSILHASLIGLQDDTLEPIREHYTHLLSHTDPSFARTLLTHRRQHTALGARLRRITDRVEDAHHTYALAALSRRGLDPDIFAPQALLFSSSMTPILLGLLERHLDHGLPHTMCAKLLCSQHLALAAHIFEGKTMQP